MRIEKLEFEEISFFKKGIFGVYLETSFVEDKLFNKRCVTIRNDIYNMIPQ